MCLCAGSDDRAKKDSPRAGMAVRDAGRKFHGINDVVRHRRVSIEAKLYKVKDGCIEVEVMPEGGIVLKSVEKAY